MRPRRRGGATVVIPPARTATVFGHGPRSTLRVAVAAIVTAVAALFRHDYGVYLAAKRLGTYLALTTVCLLPSAVWVQAHMGIPGYLRQALETSASEISRTTLRLPAFDFASPFTGDGLQVITYYAFWAVVVVAAIVLALRLFGRGQPVLGPAEYSTIVGLLVLATVVNYFFLRSNLGHPAPQGSLGHLIAREFSQEECRDEKARSGFDGGGGSPEGDRSGRRTRPEGALFGPAQTRGGTPPAAG